MWAPSENITNWVQDPPAPVQKPPKHVSKHDPKVPPVGSTFGLEGTTYVTHLSATLCNTLLKCTYTLIYSCSPPHSFGFCVHFYQLKRSCSRLNGANLGDDGRAVAVRKTSTFGPGTYLPIIFMFVFVALSSSSMPCKFYRIYHFLY